MVHIPGTQDRQRRPSSSIENIADIEAGMFDESHHTINSHASDQVFHHHDSDVGHSLEVGDENPHQKQQQQQQEQPQELDGSSRTNPTAIASSGLSQDQTHWMISTFQTNYGDNDYDDDGQQSRRKEQSVYEDSCEFGSEHQFREAWNPLSALRKRRKRKTPFMNENDGNIADRSLRRTESNDSFGIRSGSSVISARGVQLRCMSCSLFLILLLGIAACTIILSVGTQSVQEVQRAKFDDSAHQVRDIFQEILRDTEFFGLWTHQACTETILERQRLLQQQQDGTYNSRSPDRPDPYGKFRRFFQYVSQAPKIDQRVTCAVYVADADRSVFENETKARFDSMNLPDPSGALSAYIDLGFNEVRVSETGQYLELARRSHYEFYWPIHYIEPAEAVVPTGFDLYSRNSVGIDIAVSTGKPAVGLRAPDVKFRDALARLASSTYTSEKEIAEAPPGTSTSYSAYIVTLLHPGVPRPDGQPTRHLAVTPIAINRLLHQGYEELVGLDHTLKIMIYDTSDSKDPSSSEFLGGGIFHRDGVIRHEGIPIEFMAEIPYDDAIAQTANSRRPTRYQSIMKVAIASSEWTMIVSTASDEENSENQRQQLIFIAVGAVTILIATIFLSLLIYNNARRIRNLSKLKASSEAEKAALRLDVMRQAAHAERDLNDFIAHEVRNPLNAALSANTFVSASVNEENPLQTEESRLSVREDVQIIDSSLQFINELLRNMLDMHRAASQQLNVEWSQVDVLRDVLEPVSSMIYRRGANFDVIVDCKHPTVPSSNIIVETDPLRLKQIMLNLGRNSAKFVQKGYIRFRTDVVDGSLHLFVEDSGPGVPAEKRGNLFGRFQESLDRLNQGTGIGLNLCKNLAELLRAELWLDESYDSGIPGSPGARFVLNLRTPIIEEDATQGEEEGQSNVQNAAPTAASVVTVKPLSDANTTIAISPPLVATSKDGSTGPDSSSDRQIPEGISVLFVDDDFTLRKLFVRAVKRVTKDWIIDEASNGETALCKVEEKDYDIIFMDMYMTAIEKQLLGTEATRELRSKGCKSVIFGLSANDLEEQFLDAGGDGFIMKPFPCKPDPLKKELFRVLDAGGLVKTTPVHEGDVTDATTTTGQLQSRPATTDAPTLETSTVNLPTSNNDDDKKPE